MSLRDGLYLLLTRAIELVLYALDVRVSNLNALDKFEFQDELTDLLLDLSRPE